MNKDEHLTSEQIASYSTNRMTGDKGNMIGKHLLVCDECRKRMPPPTVEQVLQAVFGVGEDDSEFTDEDISEMAAVWRGRFRD